ncbi:hypothetical protein E3P92_02430 [Wallemia ichthyophaga]|nr:hypothetical protein E3P92_02430 [Wallemia ichthyophaga]
MLRNLYLLSLAATPSITQAQQFQQSDTYRSTATPTVSNIPLSTASISPSLPSSTEIPHQDAQLFPQPWCSNPIFCPSEILQSVAFSQLYADGKTFVDKPTKFSTQDVLDGWSSVNGDNQQNLTIGQIEQFVKDYFGPEGSELVEVLIQIDDSPSFLDNIDDDLLKGFIGTVHTYWSQLIRQVNSTATCDNDECDSTLLNHPDTFVVPGGRFRELYYWDSYFSFLGMLRSGLSQEVKMTLNNFINAIDNYEFIPNGFRSYYLNRSQPPFFALMVEDYVNWTNDTDFLDTAMPAIEKEISWWQNNRTSTVESPWSGKMHSVARYNVTNTAPRPESYLTDFETANQNVEYTDEEKQSLYAELSSAAESGWDFSSRWSKSPRANEGLADQKPVLRELNIRQIIPVDLNSILYKVHMAAASLYQMTSSNKSQIDGHRERAEEIKEAILDLNWDDSEDSLVFKDFNTTSSDYSDAWSLASYYPYWAGIIPGSVLGSTDTAQSAFAGLRFVLDRYNGSLPATLFESGMQWDMNAWAPLQYIAVKALEALPDNVTAGALQRPEDGQSTYSLVPSKQLGLDDESQAPTQPLYNISGSTSNKDGFMDEYDCENWRECLANEVAQRFVSSTFCSWYTTGGSIPNMLNQLPAEKLAQYDADSSYTGYMFEKYNSTNLVAAGGGGEYDVVVGFGMTNGVLIEFGSEYGSSLVRPNCPGVQITERQAARRQLAPLFSGAHVPLEESDSEDHSSYPMQSTTELPQYSSHPFNEYDESPFQYPRSPPQPASYGYAPVQEPTIMMPEAQRLPEPEAQVFVSSDATHGPNPNPMPTGVQLYDAPYTNPSDPFVDDERMPIRRLNSDTEGVGESFSLSSIAADSSNIPLQDTAIRYGGIPQRVPRRYKTTKRVELQDGNLVLDCPVPTRLLDMCHNREGDEFTHMRYTAATCDPSQFDAERYTLRQQMYSPPRRTEIMICLTMYNEDEFLFTRTMHSVVTNIVHLCSRGRSKTWGDEGWKKVVVVIISDGRQKIHSRTLATIAALGAYQDGVAKNVVQGRPVTAHIYEYTSQIDIKPDMKFNDKSKRKVPIQIIFCLKEKNQKKINSHRWFFSAFCESLQPNVCMLLDVGTSPGPRSIYHLWKSFDVDSNTGGACGEIVTFKGNYMSALLNPLVAAQNFEYKMSNILDKPLESIFGYITVLPGAFSAYRWVALQNDENGQGPLEKYFLGETLHGGDAGIFTANMYLAEDRILCWELVSKRNMQWTLHYVKTAKAYTDVPDRIPELISQRRRWLNGSFFAAIHSVTHFYNIYRSGHTVLRQFWLHVEMIYQLVNLVFSWFAIGNYFIVFRVLSSSMLQAESKLKALNVILEFLYIALLALSFLQAMGNRPQGNSSKWGYLAAFIGFALITSYMIAVAFYLAVTGIQNVINSHNGSITAGDLFSDQVFITIVISITATYGLYLISSILFFEPWHMLTSFFQYLMIAPSYINVLNVYAFCNTHDISWGTKGDTHVATDLGVAGDKKQKGNKEIDIALPTDHSDINAAYEDALHTMSHPPPPHKEVEDPATKQADYYASFRTNTVLCWVLSNALLGAAILSSTSAFEVDDGSHRNRTNIYIAIVLYFVAGLSAIRFIGRKDAKTAGRGPVVSIDSDNEDSRLTSFNLRPASPEPRAGFVSTAPSPHSKSGRKRNALDNLDRNGSKVFKKPKQDLIPNRKPVEKDKTAGPAASSKENTNLYSNQYKRENIHDIVESAHNAQNRAIQFASPEKRNWILDMVPSPKKSDTPKKAEKPLTASKTSQNAPPKGKKHMYQLTEVDDMSDIKDLLNREETVLHTDTSSSQMDVDTMESLIDLQKLIDKEKDIDREAELHQSSTGSGASPNSPRSNHLSSKSEELIQSELTNRMNRTTSADKGKGKECNNNINEIGEAKQSEKNKDESKASDNPYAILDRKERLELELRKQRWQMCTFEEWKEDGVEIIEEFAELIHQVQERITSKVTHMTDYISKIQQGKTMLGEQKLKLQVAREEVNDVTKALIFKKRKND